MHLCFYTSRVILTEFHPKHEITGLDCSKLCCPLQMKSLLSKCTAKQAEKIGLFERMNSELKMELAAKESELTKKDLKIAVIEETNGR